MESKCKLLLCTEKSLSSSHDRVLVWIIRVIFRGYFENCRDGLLVGVNNVSDHFSDVLVDKDDINIASFDERFESFFKLLNGCPLVVDNKIEIRNFGLVQVTNSAEQKADACVFISNKAY